MFLSLRSDHKEHLSLLTSQPTPVIIDFCKLAIDFLQNGPNEKRYETAAQKLQVEIDAIQNSIFGLINLLLLSCKHKLCEADFRDSVLTLGFNQEQQTVLSKFYESKQNEISTILAKSNVQGPHFHDLEWRFEALVSSRCMLQQATPLFTMDLSLKTETSDGTPGKVEHILLQTDPTNLNYITNELEKALMESRCRFTRKIQRALKSNQ